MGPLRDAAFVDREMVDDLPPLRISATHRAGRETEPPSA
jgi:hypothetical protein